MNLCVSGSHRETTITYLLRLRSTFNFRLMTRKPRAQTSSSHILIIIETISEPLPRVQRAKESVSIEFAGTQDEEHVPVPDRGGIEIMKVSVESLSWGKKIIVTLRLEK